MSSRITTEDGLGDVKVKSFLKVLNESLGANQRDAIMRSTQKLLSRYFVRVQN